MFAGAAAVQAGTSFIADSGSVRRVTPELEELARGLGLSRLSDLTGTVRFS